MPATNEPLRIAVRRLRWFRAAFHRHAEAYGRELGCDFAIDDTKLSQCFVNWLKSIERQKPADKSERRAFFEFAAGLMLRELIAVMPLKATSIPARVGPDSAAAFWPEGYACTLFCLEIHAAAMQQEFHAGTALADAFDDLRQWWSFRENAGAEKSYPAGFLQLLLGHQPNWTMPDVFRVRLLDEISGDTPTGGVR